MEIVLNEIGLAVLVGLLILLAFVFANCFQAALRPKSYDDVLSELKGQDGKKTPTSPKKKTKRSGSKRLSASVAVNGEDAGEEGRPRFKRAESLKNEHVVFADEISAEDEKFSPPAAHEIEAKIEGILHNREEDPNVNLDVAAKDTDETNAFEDIQPLDDMGLEIRRKSLQSTPGGSQANSIRGSRTDLVNLGNDSDDEEQEVEVKRTTLTFATQVNGGGSNKKEPEQFDLKRYSKTLRRTELSIEEINILIEILLKKEEQTGWVNASKKNSVLFELKREIESRETEVKEAQELVTSLQGRLKQIRSEFAEEKGALRRELEEKNLKLSQQSSDLKTPQVTSNGDLDDLRAQLKAEREENVALNKAIKEQQTVIAAALKRINPSLSKSEGEYCQEHLEWFKKFVEKEVADSKLSAEDSKTSTEEG